MMDEGSLSKLATWVTGAGLAGHPEPAMLTGFCERLVAAGVPLASGLVIIDTLHPIHEGHATRWRRDTPETTLTGETVFGPPTVQVTPGMRLSKRDKLVLVHIRRRGRVLRSALLVALSRYRISAADLTATIATLVRAGIVAEHRELASNGHMKTTYSVAPAKEP